MLQYHVQIFIPQELKPKEIIGVKGKPDIIDIIEKKRLQWYGHVKRINNIVDAISDRYAPRH
jgi:hypothetical protein